MGSIRIDLLRSRPNWRRVHTGGSHDRNARSQHLRRRSAALGRSHSIEPCSSRCARGGFVHRPRLGADLAVETGAAGSELRRRRGHRCGRARHGDVAERTPRATGRGREPRWCGRQHRYGRRCALRARRAHAAAHLRRSDPDQSPSVQAGHRRGERPDPGRTHRALGHLLHRASGFARPYARGVHRAREGESRQAELRLRGQRHAAAHRHRSADARNRHRSHARAVQGIAAGAGRSDRRSGRFHFRRRCRDLAHQGRQGAPARGTRADAIAGIPRCADHGRGRHQSRHHAAVRRVRAGGHARGCRHASEP